MNLQILPNLLLVIAGYLLGSISSAILITRLWTGKDIRTLGNRNAGGSNVARSVGMLPAVLVAVLDIAKGALPMLAARALGFDDAWGFAAGMAAVIGHSFPLYFGFRGGKGLATALGTLVVLAPLETVVSGIVLALVFYVLTGSAVTGTLTAFVLMTGLIILRGHAPLTIAAPGIALAIMFGCTIPQILYDMEERPEGVGLLRYWFSPRSVKKERESGSDGA